MSSTPVSTIPTPSDETQPHLPQDTSTSKEPSDKHPVTTAPSTTTTTTTTAAAPRSSGVSFPYGSSSGSGVSFPYGNSPMGPSQGGMRLPPPEFMKMMMMMGMPPPPPQSQTLRIDASPTPTTLLTPADLKTGKTNPEPQREQHDQQHQPQPKLENNTDPRPTAVEPFTNTQHVNPHRNDTIIGTDGLPAEPFQSTDPITGLETSHQPHTPNNHCACGQYHSVLSPQAVLVRSGYRFLLRGGAFDAAIEMSRGLAAETTPDANTATPMSPFQLMMEMNKFLSYWSQNDAEAFGEVIQDDLRRKRLGVKEDLIEVSFDSAPVITQSDRLEAISIVEQTGQVTKLIAPLIQEQVDKIESSEP